MNNQTIEKLRNMRLGAMAQLHLTYVEQNRLASMTCDEYLALLTDHQWEQCENSKVERLLKQAALRQGATMVDINYMADRNLDKNMFARLGHLTSQPEKRTSLSAEPLVQEKVTSLRRWATRPVYQE